MNNDITNEYYLERFALGELSVEDKKEINELISEDSTLRDKLETIELSNCEILALYPPSVVRAQIEKRLAEDKYYSDQNLRPSRTFSLRRIVFASAALIPFVLLILMILPGGKSKIDNLPFEEGPESSFVKGQSDIDLSSTQLLVFRKNSGSVDKLQDGNRAKAGDLLQLAYIAVHKRYGVILSLDARGSVTLHFPSGVSASTELELKKRAFLPNAFELDDAPDFERFLFITSDFPIDVAHILKQAQELASNYEQAENGNLELSPEFSQYSILILKGEKQ